MAKTLVVNTLGSTTKSFSLTADDTAAAAFCAAMLDGEYEGYLMTGEAGTDNGITAYNLAQVQISATTGEKTYIKLAVKSTIDDVEIQNALLGITVNGVKADKVFVSMREVKVGA